MGTHLLRRGIGTVVVALAGLVFFCGGDASAAAGDWRAGFAAAKITPQKPVPLAGYAARVKPFTSVDQDIEAKALALKDAQGNRAVLVTVVASGKRRPIHGPLKCAMVEAQLPLQTPDEQTLRKDA